MANFNEKVKRGIGYILCAQEFFIYRTVTNKEFTRMIHDDLYLLPNTYRLFIQYKTTHRAKKWRGVVSCGITRMETTWQIPATASSCEV